MLRSGSRTRGRSPVPDTLLGGLSVDDFLKKHWQRRPLLVRQALPAIKPPLSPQQLMRLAADDCVQSRLVSAFASRWQLTHGPFETGDLPALTRKRWTLLVQGVNLHDDAAHDLMSHFRFIPDARLDDLMISLASDQGGVGPHLDSYDVFLVQVWGSRRWRIAPPGQDAFQPGLPLKILQRFEPTEEWVLEPGDMLYVPPGWAHDGVAQGPCMTASVGFRAPSRLEFLREFLAQAADNPGGTDPRFQDWGRPATRHAAALPDDLDSQLRKWASTWRPTKQAIDDFIGRFLTEPAAQVFFEPSLGRVGSDFIGLAARNGLSLDRRTRMMYRGRSIFINGEALAMPSPSKVSWLQKLADERYLSAADVARALRDPAVAEALEDWAEAGWLSSAKRPTRHPSPRA
jgi:50S ribosomal protein L16 3-hydroxylase